MANTGARTPRLPSPLQTHRYWQGAEPAERLGVSVRTMRRDIDRLTVPQGDGFRLRPRDLPADAVEFVRAGLDDLPRSYRAEALIDAPAAAVRERIGRWSTVEEVDAGHRRNGR